MGTRAISVEGLGKKYTLGAQAQTYGTLRDSLMDAAALPWRAAAWMRRGRPAVGERGHRPEFWALRDVSFDVSPGEVLGIVGRNGAGKSTLLKVLSQITEPTRGRIRTNGRVASLLEVGTGFHPELTGRENVFLNGAILGMSRAEIVSKFDEIVAFAEVEQFVDTPVKHYSSGMYLRLAFAVAAHLESEILIVDEVLAVGDVAFQRKCLGKMGAVAEDGRTVLLVSHNLGVVQQLCPKCLWLDQGRMRQYGPTSIVVPEYTRTQVSAEGTAERLFDEDPEKEFQMRAVRLISSAGVLTQAFTCDEPIMVEIDCQVHQRIPGLYGYFHVLKPDGTVVMVSDSFDCVPNPLDDLQVGHHFLRIVVPARSLAPGDYTLGLSFTSPHSRRGFYIDSPGIILGFRLDDFSSRRGNERLGFFSTQLAWDLSRVESVGERPAESLFGTGVAPSLSSVEANHDPGRGRM